MKRVAFLLFPSLLLVAALMLPLGLAGLASAESGCHRNPGCGQSEHPTPPPPAPALDTQPGPLHVATKS